jgi:hypothetical protein
MFLYNMLLFHLANPARRAVTSSIARPMLSVRAGLGFGFDLERAGLPGLFRRSRLS